MSRMQGSKYPVVVEVNQLFKELASDLESQLSDQEHQLFPYIKQLVYASRDGKSVSSPRINLSTWSTEVDHQQMAVKLNLILKLLSNLDIANESETTPAVLLYKLRAFQNDLYQHIYLEHDILLPRAMELESKTLIA